MLRENQRLFASDSKDELRGKEPTKVFKYGKENLSQGTGVKALIFELSDTQSIVIACASRQSDLLSRGQGYERWARGLGQGIPEPVSFESAGIYLCEAVEEDRLLGARWTEIEHFGDTGVSLEGTARLIQNQFMPGTTGGAEITNFTVAARRDQATTTSIEEFVLPVQLFSSAPINFEIVLSRRKYPYMDVVKVEEIADNIPKGNPGHRVTLLEVNRDNRINKEVWNCPSTEKYPSVVIPF